MSEMELLATKTELLAMNADLPYGIKRIDAYFNAIDKYMDGIDGEYLVMKRVGQ